MRYACDDGLSLGRILFCFCNFCGSGRLTQRGALQGEIVELCKWTVDLGSLPSFQENSNMPHPNGFYTGQSCVVGFQWTGIVDNRVCNK